MFKFVVGLAAGLALALVFAGPVGTQLAQVGEWLAWASLVTLL